MSAAFIRAYPELGSQAEDPFMRTSNSCSNSSGSGGDVRDSNMFILHQQFVECGHSGLCVFTLDGIHRNACEAEANPQVSKDFAYKPHITAYEQCRAAYILDQ